MSNLQSSELSSSTPLKELAALAAGASVKPSPGAIEATKEAKNILYQLDYVQGGGIVHKFFYLPSVEMRKVIERAQEYCKNTGKRFIHVHPFLTNLDEDEKKFLES